MDDIFITVDGIVYYLSGGVAVVASVDETTREKLVIPDTVSYLGKDYIVNGIYKSFKSPNFTIKSVFIPKHIVIIYDEFLFFFMALEEVIVDPDNSSLLSVDGCLYDKEKTSLQYVPACTTGTFQIPEGIKKLESLGISVCKNIKHVIIPSSLEKIESNFAICKCTFEIDERNQYFISHGDDLYSKDGTVLYRASPTLIKGDYKLDEHVDELAFGAFNFNNNLTSIIVQRGRVGVDSFCGCKHLHYAIFGESVESIRNGVFTSCSEFRELFLFSKNPEAIHTEEHTFNDNLYKNATLHVIQGLKEKYQQLEPWKKIVNIIDDLIPGQSVNPQELEQKYVATHSNSKIQENVVYDEDDDTNNKKWIWPIVAIIILLGCFIYYQYREKNSNIPTTNNSLTADSIAAEDAVAKDSLPTDFLTDYTQLKIGDFYYNDGSFSHQKNTNKECVGIVFSLNTTAEEQAHGWTHGQIVALKDANNGKSFCTWGSYGEETNNPQIKASIDFPDDSVYNIILEDKNGYSYSNSNYTKSSSFKAFHAARTYPIKCSNFSGWYLPTVGQWGDIIQNLGNVALSSKKIDLHQSDGGDAPYVYVLGFDRDEALDNMEVLNFRDKCYWTSSECFSFLYIFPMSILSIFK
jgi:hypothetical protein